MPPADRSQAHPPRGGVSDERRRPGRNDRHTRNPLSAGRPGRPNCDAQPPPALHAPGSARGRQHRRQLRRTIPSVPPKRAHRREFPRFRPACDRLRIHSEHLRDLPWCQQPLRLERFSHNYSPPSLKFGYGPRPEGRSGVRPRRTGARHPANSRTWPRRCGRAALQGSPT